MSKVWLITGTSTGFGRELAEAALQAGHQVAATARKPETLSGLSEKYGDSVLTLRLDVTKEDTIAEAVKATTDKWGRIDVLVNNAGYGLIGAVEELTDAQIRAQFDTNFFGALNVVRAVLPTMRAQKSGHILNLSSVAGLVSFPVGGVYSASKFALEAVSEAMAGELASQGVYVTLIEPGLFRTDFAGNMVSDALNPITDYAAVTGPMLDWARSVHGQQPGDPHKAALAMIAITEEEKPPLRLLLGADALGFARQKLESLKANFDAYESVTVNTAYPGAVMGAIGG